MSTEYAISWKTRDRRLVRRVCSYLGVRPEMNINRVTHVGKLKEEQLQALQELVSNGSIQIYTFQKNHA